MPEEVKRKRGRPPKQKLIEQSSAQKQEPVKQEPINEINSFSASISFDASQFLFSCGVYNYFKKQDIDNILRNPVLYHEEAIRLSDFIYTKNGIVSNSIDYMTSLPCLDKVIISSKNSTKSKKKKNKELMQSALKMIDDKMFIRDALHTEMREGTAFYYFDIRQGTQDRNKFMTDYDVENIVEINEIGINARIITLPWRYTKIVGKKNGRYVLAFNLRYFDDFTGEQLDRKLKKYPPEITEGYDKKHNGLVNGDWMILDNNKTMARKIKCKDSEPWGRSLIIAALEDVLYKDYFTELAEKTSMIEEKDTKISELNASIADMQKLLDDMKKDQETTWAEMDILQKEIAKAKVAEKLGELDSALAEFSAEEKEVAKDDIEKLKSEISACEKKEELNSIDEKITAIKSEICMSIVAEQKKAAADAKIAEQNSARNDDVEDIFSEMCEDIDAEEKEEDTNIF